MKVIKILFVSLLLFVPSLHAQFLESVDTTFFQSLHYRCIGPFRGGRSAAVTGVTNDPLLYYFGATGGGVWKTSNGGQTWENISDGYFGGSVGAVEVSEWDPNVIYAGGGEVTVRGNVSHGSGMWKSTDAGKSWKNIGLTDSRHIPKIQIHPRNPDIVYAAALGHLFGPNKERGVFRSTDGGDSWQNVLFVSDKAGAVDVEMDPVNPRILYAAAWRVIRTPYSLESGGEGSGLWKSTDGGDTWKNISSNDGLPKGAIGIIGISVSPVDHDRVWAIVEAENGGVFRSDDAGKSWIHINNDRSLRQRAWYYTRIYADPFDIDKVYVLNVRFWKSKDGGKTFNSIRTPHGDHHALWIAPEDAERMIVGDDGGAQISFDGGVNWSTYYNQPTAQFYRVTTDDHFPYRIYGAQQDNSTVRILSRAEGYSIDERDWQPTAGGESGWIAPDPNDNDIVYGGSYGGYLTYYNHRTEELRSVNVWPDNPMGHGAGDFKYRFQWNYPIIFSKHKKNTLYVGGNVLFKSTNGGENWKAISPDLTRNDSAKLGPSGGMITKDNTSVEYYCTIFSIAESSFDPNVIWVGSDDGLIHITRNGGKTWTNVSPPGDMMPEWIQINSLEANPFEPGGLYVAATMYKSDDFSPYIYKTSDFGESWEKITDGINSQHFTRVVRADPNRKGLLYAGTESGVYISFNDGDSWQPFQLDLPETPVTDLAVKNSDLIVATQGRSFYVLDDLIQLYQLSDNIFSSSKYLFKPGDSYRMDGGGGFSSLTRGENPPNGVILKYFFSEAPDSEKVKLEILDAGGEIIDSFSPVAKEKRKRIDIKKGVNKFIWNMRYPNAEKFKGIVLWGGGLSGPKAAPGNYSARLISDSDTLRESFEILKDPRSSSSAQDLRDQFNFLLNIRDKLTEIHSAIKEIRTTKQSITDVTGKLKQMERGDSVIAYGKKIIADLDKIENELYQTKNRSSQDPLNFPIKLNNRLSSLAASSGTGDFKPTAQSYEVRDYLYSLIDKELSDFKKIKDSRIPVFNKLALNEQIPPVLLDQAGDNAADD